MQEAIPQLTRVFVPTFPPDFTTTTLSVDDLVQHCYKAGYGKATSDESLDIGNSGALTMAVQPRATITVANESPTLGEVNASSSITTPGVAPEVIAISPSDIEFGNALKASIDEASSGATALANASTALNNMEWPSIEAFDPTSDFDISFDPNAGDSWDALDMATTTNNTVDWSAFIDFP